MIPAIDGDRYRRADGWTAHESGLAGTCVQVAQHMRAAKSARYLVYGGAEYLARRYTLLEPGTKTSRTKLQSSRVQPECGDGRGWSHAAIRVLKSHKAGDGSLSFGARGRTGSGRIRLTWSIRSLSQDAVRLGALARSNRGSTMGRSIFITEGSEGEMASINSNSIYVPRRSGFSRWPAVRTAGDGVLVLAAGLLLVGEHVRAADCPGRGA